MQNQTLIQYFHWYYNDEQNLWTKALNEAKNLAKTGITGGPVTHDIICRRIVSADHAITISCLCAIVGANIRRRCHLFRTREICPRITDQVAGAGAIAAVRAFGT
ncbi:MAG: hypothetical protein EOO07_34355, partial [Chitinophagaceae bacterium]